MRQPTWMGVFALLLAALCGVVQAAETPRIYALTHATAHVSPDKTVEDATIVLRNGFVDSVRAGGAVPKDAVEIDLTGKHVYAGLIDAVMLRIKTPLPEGSV